MASGTRSQLLNLFGLHGPCAIPQVAPSLGTYPEALYHHVKKLVSAGILLQAGSGERGGRREALYDVAAAAFDLELPPWSDNYTRAVAKLTNALFEASARDAQRVLPLRATGAPMGQTTLVRRLDCRLTPKKAAELRRRLEEIDAWVLAPSDDPDAISHSFLIAISPLVGK